MGFWFVAWALSDVAKVAQVDTNTYGLLGVRWEGVIIL